MLDWIFKRTDAEPRPIEPQAVTQAQLDEASRAIDEYYDSLLINGMPLDEAVAVEQARENAHAKVRRKVMSFMTRGYGRV